MREKRKSEDWTIKEYHSMLGKRVRFFSNPDGIWGKKDSSFEGIVESVTSYTTCENKPSCYMIVSTEKLDGHAIHPYQWCFVEVFLVPVSVEELLTHPNQRLRDFALATYG